jgi:uncharacterized protein
MDPIGGFDWDAGNRDKCRKHDVSLADIETFFRGRIAVHPARIDNKEERFIAVGSTAQGGTCSSSLRYARETERR